jgi:hypothetical protein
VSHVWWLLRCSPARTSGAGRPPGKEAKQRRWRGRYVGRNYMARGWRWFLHAGPTCKWEERGWNG